MRSPTTDQRVLANSLHHLPPGSVATRRTNPNKWMELTVGVRRPPYIFDPTRARARGPVT